MDTTSNTTTKRLIAMAVSLVGDPPRVMRNMQCSEADFLEYREGKKDAPWPELDRWISMISKEQASLVVKNQNLSAELRARTHGRSW